jgi:hypothetical protein
MNDILKTWQERVSADSSPIVAQKHKNFWSKIMKFAATEPVTSLPAEGH